MTDYNTSEPKGIDLPTDAFRVGIDESDRQHWYSPMTHRVWVVRDGDVIHERSIASIADWVLEYERQLGSWQERDPVETTDGLASFVRDLAEVNA